MTLSSYSENVSYHQIEINSNDNNEINTLVDKLQYKIVSSMTKRTELNIPIKEIAKKTKIPVKFIKWIEKLDFKHLPPMPMRISTPASGHDVAMAPKMSPSLMSLMRAPVERTSSMRSL